MLAGLIPGCGGESEEANLKDDALRIAAIYVEARNHSRFEMLDEIYHQNAVIYDPFQPNGIQGLEDIKKYFAVFHQAFPKGEFQIKDIFSGPEKIVLQWSFSGIHQGPLGNVEPSGKQINFNAVSVSTVEDGRVTLEIGYFNLMDIYSKLGFRIIPPAEDTTEQQEQR